jgi:hypothetical protein
LSRANISRPPMELPTSAAFASTTSSSRIYSKFFPNDDNAPPALDAIAAQDRLPPPPSARPSRPPRCKMGGQKGWGIYNMAAPILVGRCDSVENRRRGRGGVQGGEGARMVDRRDLGAREAGAGRRVTHERVGGGGGGGGGGGVTPLRGGGHALACDRRRNGGAGRGLRTRIEESPSIKGAGAVIQGCGARGDGGLSVEVAVGRTWAGGGGMQGMDGAGGGGMEGRDGAGGGGMQGRDGAGRGGIVGRKTARAGAEAGVR